MERGILHCSSETQITDSQEAKIIWQLLYHCYLCSCSCCSTAPATCCKHPSRIESPKVYESTNVYSCLICKFLKTFGDVRQFRRYSAVVRTGCMSFALVCVLLCQGDLLLRVCLPWITFAGAALWDCFLYLFLRSFSHHRCAFRILFNSILRSFASCTPHLSILLRFPSQGFPHALWWKFHAFNF